MGHFEDLFAVNVNEHAEDKEGLTYLSWAWAWAEVKKRYPNASYTIWKDESGRPYAYDELTGFMVYTTCTIDGITHEMWLPVMDSRNKAMKSQPYTYKTRSGEVTVAAATMFDINKTIMRCLTKNLAMFGLGLYIYAGEDLPQPEVEEKKAEAKKNAEVKEADLKQKLMAYVKKQGYTEEEIAQICTAYKVESLEKLNLQQCEHYIGVIKKNGGKI